jgi:hypothetical protein
MCGISQQAMRANAACYTGATVEADYPALSARQQQQRLEVLGLGKDGSKAEL